MPDNAFVKIGTALLKHQVKKLVGEETLGVLSEELADIGGDKLDAWLGDKSTIEELEKAAKTAEECFHDSVGDHELEQWMVSLPIGDLPKVLKATEKLPTSPNEKELEDAIYDAVAGWQKLSPEQTEKAVNSFLSCLRSALLPIEKQTLMVIGRSVLRTEDKMDLLIRWFEQYVITGRPVEVKQLNPEPNEGWHLAHPYPMPPNFTGRVEERKMLVHWLNNDKENRLFILRALGGFGKSALTWHWLTHDVDSNEWKKVVFWSFYEGDASFEHFIEETLKYLKLEVPQGGRPQVDELLKTMQSQKILLIMDGFERALRAYSSMNAAYQGDENAPAAVLGGENAAESNSQLDCVNINAEIFLKHLCSLPNIQSKILMTTRLTPRAVKPRGEFMLGCREEELISMQPAEAVEFFRKQKIKGTHAEIEAACAPYGYHPLSLRLLAGRILKDFENPADIIVVQRLKIDGDIIQQKHHVLEVSYNSLPPHEGKLLSTIACFRSPVELKTLQSITENKDSRNDDLHDLVERGLLHFDDKNKKFDLHPIVRRYAYERLTAPDRTATHTHLRDYFAAIDVPAKPQSLNDLAPVIELYHHCIHANRYSEAAQIFHYRLNDFLYISNGEYILCIELLEGLQSVGENALSEEDPHAQSWLLNKLALCYNRTGRSYEAEKTFRRHITIRENMGYLPGVAIGMGNLSEVLIRMGRLKEATDTLKHKLDISNQIGDQFKEMVGRQDYGLVLAYQGEFEESDRQLKLTADWLSKNSSPREESISWTFYTLSMILQRRTNDALDAAKLANQLASIEGRKRDIIRTTWLLGLTNVLSDRLSDGAQYLEISLVECRRINLVELEANILLDLARLRYDQKNYDEAKSLADEALTITERCGYVLQGADVKLFLAQYALEQEKDKAKAKEYAEEARKLATCDGPPYYYKVAYDEAVAMLAKL